MNSQSPSLPVSQSPPSSPPWQNDRTLADALRTAANFIGSEKTLDHVERSLFHKRRAIYTLEIWINEAGEVHSRLLVSSNSTIVTRRNLEWNGSAQLPP